LTRKSKIACPTTNAESYDVFNQVTLGCQPAPLPPS
jgi:hypothetical protein